MNEEQLDVIDSIKYYRKIEKENRKIFYDMEFYDDLALCEMKARDMGIDTNNIEED
jgi:hypothetical protein